MKTEDIKVGSFVVAKNDFWMADGSRKALTKGKSYQVVEIMNWGDINVDKVVIIDDRKERHYFSYNAGFFIDSTKAARKLKLERLSKC